MQYIRKIALHLHSGFNIFVGNYKSLFTSFPPLQFGDCAAERGRERAPNETRGSLSPRGGGDRGHSEGGGDQAAGV